ncbi:MAG: fimbrial biogenesis chaperone [Gemmatimonadales bacterium]
MRYLRLLAPLAMGLPATLAAQAVLIAPQAVVVDRGQRAGTFTVVNIGEDRVEVDLSTLYGVPVTDSVGNLLLDTKSPLTDSTPSAAQWIEMFPRRFALEPGARRTVRLLVRPPEGIPDREYWARLVVASRAVPRAMPVVAAEAVNVAITLEVRSVFPFLFRKGNVTTALELGEPTAVRSTDSITVRVPMTRRGNAAWVGTLRATVEDQSGRVVREAELPLGVYHTLHPRLAMSAAELADGDYRVRIEAIGRRSDLPASFVLPTAPVRRVVELRR